MNDSTTRDVPQLGATVRDPAMRRWQRRYFFQPDRGAGRRAFTARGAQRARGRTRRTALLAVRWDAARERATVMRGPLVWI